MTWDFKPYVIPEKNKIDTYQAVRKSGRLIVDVSNTLCTEEQRIRRAWHTHYGWSYAKSIKINIPELKPGMYSLPEEQFNQLKLSSHAEKK
jgi:hypothetical protein